MKTQMPFCLTLICIAQMAQSQTWNAVGSGLNGVVSNIVVVGNELYVTGAFTNAGGNPDADRIARWDGISWKAIGHNIPSQVGPIALGGDDLYVGGNFTNAGGNPDADYIARWDGVSWNALGSGLNDRVYDIEISGNDVYVIGKFMDAGGDTDADYIAHWDGVSWNAMGTPPSGVNLSINKIKIADDGKIYVGGSFLEIGGINARNIAWWDGEKWNALGDGFYGDMGVNAIAVDGNDVYVGGDGGAWGGSCGIARWDGSNWHPLGTGLSDCIYGEGAYVIAAANGNVYVSGYFVDAGDEPHTTGLAHWDGSAWSALGTPGLTHGQWPNSIALAGEDVYIGGGFQQIAGVPNSSFIARWGEPDVVSGIEDLNSDHHAVLCVYPNPTDGIVGYTFDNHVLQMHTVTLTDASGKVIVDEETRDSKINIDHLPAGLYFLRAQNKEKSGIAKIVKY